MLDEKPIKVVDAIKIAINYYAMDQLEHALRVATYVAENLTIPNEYRDECLSLAVMHDLLEDTQYKPECLPENFEKALRLLTKPKEMPYDEYCKAINSHCDTAYGRCAYWVKLADMKDHLSLTETLTDRLKKKYLSGLRYLL